MPDERDVVPAHMLITVIKNGGLLTGAFKGSEMIGFAFGFPGMEGTGAGRRLKHCSHMLAVLPQARAKGLGAELKWRQRTEVLAQGVDLITWTYDPLQATNAHLNLNRLGAIARRYIRDAYGEMMDGLNAGITSDRFEVEWELLSPRVAARAARAPLLPSLDNTPSVFELEVNHVGLPQVMRVKGFEGDRVALQVPADINALKRLDMALAAEWRAQTRKWFEAAFHAGYTATGIVRQTDTNGTRRAFYVLEKQDTWGTTTWRDV